MLQAYSDSELLKGLAEIEISTRGRSEGRTKERYAIARLLSALVGKDCISYPLCLIQRERPDFLLTLDTKQIGIEHIEAVSQNEAHKTVLREKGIGPNVYFISHHHPGEPIKTKNELIEEIKANNGGDGWAGDSPEREWAVVIFYSIEKKVATLQKDGFKRFEEDWLLIDYNWNLPAPDKHKSAHFLLNLVTKSEVLHEFNRIYIITGQYLCEVASTGIKFYDIKDLWN